MHSVVTMGKQIITQNFQSKIALFLQSSFLVHVDWCIHDLTNDAFESILLCHELIRLNDRRLKGLNHLFMVFRIKVKKNDLANFFVCYNSNGPENNKERYGLFYTRKLDNDGMTKPIVFGIHHHVDLFWRNTLEIRDRLDFCHPSIFRTIFTNIETVYAILCRALLT